MRNSNRAKPARPICVYQCSSVDLFFFLLALFFLPGAIASAATYRIPADFTTIQAAIDASVDGDEIVVSPGTYVENIQFNGKNVVLTSTDPEDLSIVESTIVDGGQNGRVITFLGTETSACAVRGFTITNGRAIGGGAIHGADGSGSVSGASAVIENNIFLENYSGLADRTEGGDGGAINNFKGLISGNIFDDNYAMEGYYCDDYGNCESDIMGYGGAIYGASGSITGNLFLDNAADGEGGALRSCDVATDNLFIGNLASGGAVHGVGTSVVCNFLYNTNKDFRFGAIDSCGGDVLNNIVVDNDGAGIQASGRSGRVEGNLIYGNDTDNVYGCVNVFYNVITGSTYNVGLISLSLNVLGNIVYNNPSEPLRAGALSGCRDVVGNVIAYNQVYRAALFRCDGMILNNTIFWNTSADGSGAIDESPFLHPDATISNNILWGNTSPTGLQIADSAAATYSCIENDTSGEPTNISVDPGLMDPANGDFSLRPDSPCIDAGAYYAAAVLDAAGRARGFNGTAEPRGDGSDCDMGAYEYVTGVEGEGEGEGESTYHKADQDRDGAIALDELLRVVQFYNMQGYRCVPGTEDGYAPGKAEDMRKRMGLDRGLAHASPRFAGETCLSPRSTTSPEGVGDRHVGLEDSPACASPLERTEAELFARRREPRTEPSPVRQWREERRKQREEERNRIERKEDGGTSPFIPLQRGIEERAEDGSLRCVQSELSRGESVDYASLPSSPSPPLKGDKGGCSSHTASYNPLAKSSPSLVEQYMTKYDITLPEIPDETLALWETAKAAAARARATGETLCVPHSSDYAPQDWSIGIVELMRLIQFYNMGGYHACPDAGTEDGFCPGAEG